MERMRAIRNHVIFQFHDEVSGGYFVEKTNWGFDMGKSHERSGQDCRYVTVTHIGPEVPEEIKVGDVAIVENLQWSHGFKFEDSMYWRTDSEKVLGVVEK